MKERKRKAANIGDRPFQSARGDVNEISGKAISVDIFLLFVKTKTKKTLNQRKE